MIKLPSVQSASSQLIATIKRFPLSVLCAFTGTFCLVYLAHHRWFSWFDENGGNSAFAKIAMCCELGLCLFLAASLYSESKGHVLREKIVTQGLMLVLIIGYYFTINHYQHFGVESFTRYSLYIIASHLMVAFAPFLVKNQVNGFWQFNRALFLRFLLSFLYTLVLYLGICLAMWLLDDLLHVHIGDNYYLYAWFCMTGVFNTLFFLSGVPANIHELESDNTYLKGLKGFTQFVMLPLVTGFLLILYAYSLRIIILGNLPKGYVSYLVITFSGLGILSLLLIYPLRNSDENKWIKVFSKWFYIALYPLVVLLAFSIYHRVHQYGITADRYFIVVLALWLMCIASYFLMSNKENIKLIPISLCAIALLASFGPWGAFGVAARSQTRQLEKMLVANKILVKGVIDTNRHDVNDSINRRVESIIEYLIKIENLDMIQPWFKINLDSLDKQENNDRYYYAYGEAGNIMKHMGLPGYDDGVRSYNNNKHISFSRASRGDVNYSLNVAGYNYYSTIYSDRSAYSTHDDDTAYGYTCFTAGADSFSIVPYKQAGKFCIKLKNEIVATFDMEPVLNKWKAKYDQNNNDYVDVAGDEFNLKAEGSKYEFQLNFSRADGSIKDNKIFNVSFEGDVLTKIKE